MKTKRLTPCLICASVLLTTQTIAGTDRFDDRLTGDWRGLRDRLADSGINAFAYANAIFASNVSGGNERDTSLARGIYAGLTLDLEKIAGWDDTTLTLSGINRHGRSIDPAVGGKYSVMQLVGGQTTFLYGVTLEKSFGDDLLSLKAGRMTATDDFVGSPLYSYSLNNAVNGQIRAALFDGVMTSYPFPVWGARLQAKLTERSELKVGVFQISKDMFNPSKHGLDFGIDRDDGVSIFTQFDWHPEIAGKAANFFVGMNNAFLDLDEFGSSDITHHFVRFYAHGDIQVFRAPGTVNQGLTLFATLGYTAQDAVAIMPIQSTLGAHYRGLLPGRPNDRTVCFATYGGFSSAYSAQQVAAGQAAVSNEMVFELGHRVQLSRSAYFQPDIQYIKRPGGTGRTDDAVVLGLQFGASF